MIELKEVKDYLRIDTDAEDSLLLRFLKVSEVHLRAAVTDYDENLKDANFSELAEIARLDMVRELYERGGAMKDAEEYGRITHSIITQLQYWGRAE